MKSVAERLLERKREEAQPTKVIERKMKRMTNTRNEMQETRPEVCSEWEIKISEFLANSIDTQVNLFLLDVRVVVQVASDVHIVTGYMTKVHDRYGTIEDYVIYKVETVDQEITSVKLIDHIDVSLLMTRKQAKELKKDWIFGG